MLTLLMFLSLACTDESGQDSAVGDDTNAAGDDTETDDTGLIDTGGLLDRQPTLGPEPQRRGPVLPRPEPPLGLSRPRVAPTPSATRWPWVT